MKRCGNNFIFLFILIFLNYSIKFCYCKTVREQYRLSNTTTPIHYDIKIYTEIDQNDFQFDGEVKILLKIENVTDIVEIHTKNSTIKTIELKQLNQNENVDIKNYTINNVTEILKIHCETKLQKEFQYELKIIYESELRKDKLGFYRSSYKDNNYSYNDRKIVWLAATQFAPTEARHAFPCYDEPKFKSTFQLELIHPKKLSALSNTKILDKTVLNENLVATKFEKTPIMSTYLVAFIISDFVEVNRTYFANNKIEHIAYVRHNAHSLATFAASYGAAVFNELYNIVEGDEFQPKEIKEIKQILLPDFHFSGMENWGAITYREQRLFYNKKFHSSINLYGILYLMAHEMAHQWFGNLITHEWWTYVWLKEGFSTLYGYYGAANVYAEWNLMQKYQTDVLHYVFEIDTEAKIRAMSTYVEKQSDIKKNYDRIAYEKSSCVLRMFDNALGENVFKEGVKDFLRERKFESSTEVDLFESLNKTMQNSDSYKIDINETFGNWTHQGGYPFVTIEVKDKIIKLRQERFMRMESFHSNDFINLVWHIPINYEIPDPLGNNFKNTKAQFWMKTKEMQHTIENEAFDSSTHWLIANIQQTGYYRVNYNIENWRLIINALKFNHTQIHVANRAQLIDDAFHLAKVGELDYEIVFSLIEYLPNERDYAPWKAFHSNMQFIKYRLLNLENPKLLKIVWKFIFKITEQPLKNFGLFKIQNEAPSASITRSIIAELACNSNNTQCTETDLQYDSTDMRKIFHCEKLKKDNESILPFLEVKNLIKLSEEIESQRADYISILGCAKNENVLRNLLLYTIKNKDEDLNLNADERYGVLESVISKSRRGLQLGMDFIQKSWKRLDKSLCESCLAKAIILISKHVQHQDDVDKFNKLLGEIQIDSETTNKAAQNVINNLEWDGLYRKKIENWLGNNYGDSSGILKIDSFKFLIAISIFTNLDFNFKILIVLILPIFGLTSPIYEDNNIITPPNKLFHDHSIIPNLKRKEFNSKLTEEISYRLPNNTVPISYNIKLHTDVHKGQYGFNGINEIKLQAVTNTNSITIHGRKINIKSANLTDESGKIIDLKPIPKEPANNTEFLVFELKDGTLKEKQNYYLKIEYNGTLRTDNGGFYLSTYENKDKEIIPLATTQFESTDARHGFPCYDEPGIKAEVTIEITHGDNYTALSNMPVKNTEPSKTLTGYNVTTFLPTKRMSPYLVAFIISNFTGKFDESRNIRHGVYSRPGTEDERDFALDASVKILNKIGDYVNYQYTFPKMDQISIPDFAAGAMENWGLVTYREEMLLYNETRSTLRTKTVVANTVAHEYGHQWFGNLVSPQWWSYLWLNEGFASLFAYIGADLAYPEMDLMEHFIVAEYQRALRADEGIKRPMTHYVEHPRQIVSLFDSVSYSKAACVINMIRHHIGEKAFKASLNIYLNKMAYKSANENDLFDALQAGAKEVGVKLNVTIARLMGSWSGQPGFPLLKVTRNYENGSFTVEQEGFKNDGKTDEDLRKWVVPFNFVTANNSDFNDTRTTHLLFEKEKLVNPDDNAKFGKDDWLILNKQLTSYYRVNYDDENWDLITKALKEDPNKIHKYNRAQLISDSYRLSLNKKLNINKFFNLLEYLPKEVEYSPWSVVDVAFQFYKNRFHDNEDVYSNLQFFIFKNVEKIFEKLGVHDNSTDRHFDKYVRTIAINWACAGGSEKCLDTTNERLKELVEKQTEIEPNLQSVIYCNGLKKSTEEQFNYLFKRLLKSNDQAERQLIMSTLGCTHDKKSLKKFVESSIDENNNLRKQERINILNSVYSKHKEGFEVAVDFLKGKFNEYSKLPRGFGQTSPLDDAVKGLSQVVVSEDEKNKLLELVDMVKDHEDVDEKLKEKVEANINSSLEWIKNNVEPVRSYLAEFFKRNSAAQTALSFTALMAVIIVTIRNIF
ncbi:uncharacterized protein LOC129611947 [Condylostylus longicornis]|uniref:uncharacterized protein LOC129611947 n=1 Tax=Condylostylus longicornis TaxID=2530218 RepID=UPI00244DB7B3|nr:uncharacterized protein LOC129611947 [Condylostylus longicornis]